MKTKLALIALVSAVVIFPAVFFRTPPPTVPGLTRPAIDRTVFDNVEAGPNLRNRLQAKAENAGDDDAADEGDDGGGFFNRFTRKDDTGGATGAVGKPGGPRPDKSKVLRPRANRPVGGDKAFRPNLKPDAASTRLQKRQDILAKRRAQREQAQGGAPAAGAVEPILEDEPPLPEVDIPHEEPLPDDYGAEDGGDEGAIE